MLSTIIKQWTVTLSYYKIIVNVDAIKYVMYAGIGIYLVYIMFYYILGEKQFEKSVNVEWWFLYFRFKFANIIDK